MRRPSASNTDLTTGTVWKKLLIFFLPIAAGTCIQQLYNAVDGLIVGRFVGTIALAAVGGSAITSFVGQNLGAGRRDRVRVCVKQGMIMAIGITVVISTLLMVFAKPLLGICLFRAVWVFTIFAWIHTLPVLSYCYIASWLVTGVTMILYYRKGKWIDRSKMILDK